MFRIQRNHIKSFYFGFITLLVLMLTLFFIHSETMASSSLASEAIDIPILLYHSISDNPIGSDELSVTVSSFQEQMQYLYDNGYTPIYFDQIKQASQIKKPILITFDDGYVDNYNNAYPILKQYHFKTTLFMITRFINHDGFLSKDQMKEMSDLFSFQSHTVDHVKLNRLSNQEIEYECTQSKKTLSEITGKPVYVIAYPNGAYNDTVIRIASKSYSFAVTTLPGFSTTQTDQYELRRFGISRFYNFDQFKAFLNGSTP
jgi:peptidoglycan/xylan/chitin deacetylase (PgdA/CDA1 family)